MRVAENLVLVCFSALSVGSPEEYSVDLKSDHLKFGLFEGQISYGKVFKWSGLSHGYA